MTLLKTLATYFLCENAFHDFRSVSVLSPVILKNKTEFALKLMEAYQADGADLSYPTKVMPVIKAELFGYVDQDGISALERYNALSQYIHQVFRFEICSRCKTAREIEVDTTEASTYINTMIALLRERIYTSQDVVSKKIERNGKYAKQTHGSRLGPITNDGIAADMASASSTTMGKQK